MQCTSASDNSTIVVLTYNQENEKERHIANIYVGDEIAELERSITHGIMFLGNGEYADFPGSRLRVHLPSLFNGRLRSTVRKGAVERMPFSSIYQVDGQEERTIRIVQVHTEDFQPLSQFGSLTLEKVKMGKKSENDSKTPSTLGPAKHESKIQKKIIGSQSEGENSKYVTQKRKSWTSMIESKL